MGHKIPNRSRGVREHKPSSQQQHTSSFRRSIKDCSTAELDYRITAHASALSDVNLSIVEAQAKLTVGRQTLARLSREHEVLTAEVEGRR